MESRMTIALTVIGFMLMFVVLVVLNIIGTAFVRAEWYILRRVWLLITGR